MPSKQLNIVFIKYIIKSGTHVMKRNYRGAENEFHPFKLLFQDVRLGFPGTQCQYQHGNTYQLSATL